MVSDLLEGARRRDPSLIAPWLADEIGGHDESTPREAFLEQMRDWPEETWAAPHDTAPVIATVGRVVLATSRATDTKQCWTDGPACRSATPPPTFAPSTSTTARCASTSSAALTVGVSPRSVEGVDRVGYCALGATVNVLVIL
jgi:hypothetical protein